MFIDNMMLRHWCIATAFLLKMSSANVFRSINKRMTKHRVAALCHFRCCLWFDGTRWGHCCPMALMWSFQSKGPKWCSTRWEELFWSWLCCVMLCYLVVLVLLFVMAFDGVFCLFVLFFGCFREWGVVFLAICFTSQRFAAPGDLQASATTTPDARHGAGLVRKGSALNEMATGEMTEAARNHWSLFWLRGYVHWSLFHFFCF